MFMRDIKGRFEKGNIEPNRYKFPDGNTIGMKHGFCSNGKRHPLWKIWRSMRNRCLNPKSNQWKWYGGRNIKITEKWNNFINFYNWALPKWEMGLQIDRINNDGNYEPNNCRFIKSIENANNKSDTTYVLIDGHRISTYEAAQKYKIVSAHIIWNRLRLGWTDEEAVFMPKRSISHRGKYKI
jgi:hypothetical protein